MFVVRRAPTGEDPVAVAEFDEEADLVNVVVRLDLVCQIERRRHSIEHQIHTFLE
tara:strand:- start:549 stop:713 length:165 start_codon:yes stop_codon:yes gene_type:complete